MNERAPELQRYLLLQAGCHCYALPFEQIAEVSELKPLSPVPGAPRWCLGAVRSGGQVVAVIDLAAYCGDGPEPQPDRLVVLDRRPGWLALQVGRTQAVVLQEPSAVEQDSHGQWLQTPACRAELLNAAELIDQVAAALAVAPAASAAVASLPVH